MGWMKFKEREGERLRWPKAELCIMPRFMLTWRASTSACKQDTAASAQPEPQAKFMFSSCANVEPFGAVHLIYSAEVAWSILMAALLVACESGQGRDAAGTGQGNRQALAGRS